MPALNYKKQFADKVEAGTKRTTIRAGKRFKKGDTLYHYTGMRTKSCRKLREDACTWVSDIYMTNSGMKCNGVALAPARIEEIATADGFETVDEFIFFFRETHGFPFLGQLIEW